METFVNWFFVNLYIVLGLIGIALLGAVLTITKYFLGEAAACKKYGAQKLADRMYISRRHTPPPDACSSPADLWPQAATGRQNNSMNLFASNSLVSSLKRSRGPNPTASSSLSMSSRRPKARSSTQRKPKCSPASSLPDPLPATHPQSITGKGASFFYSNLSSISQISAFI